MTMVGLLALRRLWSVGPSRVAAAVRDPGGDLPGFGLHHAHLRDSD